MKHPVKGKNHVKCNEELETRVSEGELLDDVNNKLIPGTTELYWKLCNKSNTKYRRQKDRRQKIDDLSIKMESFIEIYETDKKHMEFFTARMDELSIPENSNDEHIVVTETIHKLEENVEGIISDLQSLCLVVDVAESKISKMEAFVTRYETAKKLHGQDLLLCTPPPTLTKRSRP